MKQFLKSQNKIPPIVTIPSVFYSYSGFLFWFIFAGVCSLFGNSTLLYISYKKKNVLKPAEYFIINLAVSDLGLTLSLYPMAITSSFYHRYKTWRLLLLNHWSLSYVFALSCPLSHALPHRWLYGKTVCSVYAFCGMLFGICSLTTLTLLSMVCFVKVCYPLYGKSSKRLFLLSEMTRD